MDRVEPEILAACREYLDFVTAPERASEEPEKRNLGLTRLLDHLAYLMNFVESSESETEDDSSEGEPEIDSEHVYKTISAAFCDLSWYPIVYPSDDLGSEKITAGDAIDDLRDIYLDISGFVWKYGNISKYQAVCDLKLMYQTHWGRHLRDLQSYLHWRLYRI